MFLWWFFFPFAHVNFRHRNERGLSAKIIFQEVFWWQKVISISTTFCLLFSSAATTIDDDKWDELERQKIETFLWQIAIKRQNIEAEDENDKK